VNNRVCHGEQIGSEPCNAVVAIDCVAAARSIGPRCRDRNRFTRTSDEGKIATRTRGFQEWRAIEGRST
jgi:hypothetical protein